MRVPPPHVRTKRRVRTSSPGRGMRGRPWKTRSSKASPTETSGAARVPTSALLHGDGVGDAPGRRAVARPLVVEGQGCLAGLDRLQAEHLDAAGAGLRVAGWFVVRLALHLEDAAVGPRAKRPAVAGAAVCREPRRQVLTNL